MYTIMTEFKDAKGFSRLHGTFTPEGLKGLGIDLDKATLVCGCTTKGGRCGMHTEVTL